MRERYTELEGEFGCEYVLEKAGEGFGVHAHSIERRHACLCLKGQVLVEICPAGEQEPQWLILDANSQAEEPEFNSLLPHRITAMEDNTVIFNRMYVRPADWRELLTWRPE
jgi:hypothetical protein